MSQATKRYAVALASIAFLTLAWIGYRLYDLYMQPIVKKTTVVRFPSNGDQQTMLDTLMLADAVYDTAVLKKALKRLDFGYRAGQFEIQEGMSSKALVDMLRLGKQKEARVVLTNGRLPGDIAKKAARFVELDSASIYKALLDSIWLDSVGLSPQTVMAIAIPNTYNVYWNSTAEEIRDRLYAECQRVWK